MAAEFRLLLVALNEGEKELPPEMLRSALSAVLAQAPVCNGLASLGGVVVARQEAAQASAWAAALDGTGLVEVAAASLGSTSCAVYGRGAEVQGLGLVEAPAREPSDGKGVAGPVLCLRGHTLALLSAHLDGNARPEQRLLPAAAAARRAAEVARAAGRGLDAALLLGDVNFAAAPRGAAAGLGGEAARMLGRAYEAVERSGEERGVYPLAEDLKALLTSGFATAGGRTALAEALDGCPAAIEVGEGAPPLVAQGVPPGSFPTYRLGDLGDAEVELPALRADGFALLDPSWEATPTFIERAYFGGGCKGHAGAIKKRKDVYRLNLGWLDRLFIAELSIADASQTAAARPRIRAEQLPCVMLLDVAGKVLDHALVAWIVTLEGGDVAARP